MTEQQPVEATPATPAPAAPAEGSQAPAPTRTAEDVEAEYKARLSGKDKAHAAEVATLQQQVQAAQAASTSAGSQAEAASTDVETLKQQLANQQALNKQQANQYQQTIRSTQYPYAAEALDPQTLASMDEAKLAGLNARLTPSVAPSVPVDPSTPPRTADVPKPIDEKTPDELKADLKRYGDQFAAELQQR